MSSKLGVAVIGAGYWGPNLVRNFVGMHDVALRWVCDLRPGRRQYIAERYPAVPLTDRVDEVLADASVDAVVIATPVSTHADLACRALSVGKHVLVEKPLAASVSECDRIVATADTANLRVAVGHIFVYHPAVLAMREGIRSGRIGRACYIESSRVNLGPPASEVDVLWDLFTHDASITLQLIDSPPVEVTAFGRPFLHPRLVDAAFVHLRFRDGAISQHHVSWLSPEKVRRVFVAASEGSFRFDDTLPENAKLRFVDQGKDTRRDGGAETAKELVYLPGRVEDVALQWREPLGTECAAFVAAVRSGDALPNDGRAGRAVVRLVEAAERSLGSGSRPVALDPED